MPLPEKLDVGHGLLRVTPELRVAMTGHDEPRLRRALDRMLRTLSRQTGIPFRLQFTPAHEATMLLHANRPGPQIGEPIDDESYTLEITPFRIHLRAATTLGILRGLQTLLQLVQLTADCFFFPAVTIKDRPRFLWRGLLLDVSRHWMPIEVIKRTLDGMEAVKMNVLHWHLSDDQGFRVESKRFPKLHDLGSDGQYYSQTQIAEIIDYAFDRGIRIVPEFDMPGHATSWFVGYPELASGPGPYRLEREWRIFQAAMNPTSEGVYQFLNDFIAEIAPLFPDPYFHVGGDEVDSTEWVTSPAIHGSMGAAGINSIQELRHYFHRRVQVILKEHGKTVVGWDELLGSQLQKSAVIQSWRGQSSLARAARHGHRAILSCGYYLDLSFPAAEHYSVDPMDGEAMDLAPQEAARILGAESCLWSELVSAENVDNRIWPRNAAIAERLWSPQRVRDTDWMYLRLSAISRKLENLGLGHVSDTRRMLGRLSGQDNVSALHVFAEVVEPIKGYGRLLAQQYTSQTPLNRLVDCVPPESETGRMFTSLVTTFLKGEASVGDKQHLRRMLTQWREKCSELGPILQASYLLRELIPVSKNLRAVAIAGLQALDHIEANSAGGEAWRSEQLTLLTSANEPGAEVCLSVVPAIRRLVEATPRTSSPLTFAKSSLPFGHAAD